jgi:DNA-binding HxlR family transcriptional regulator
MASDSLGPAPDRFPDSAYCPAFQATLELLGRRWTAAVMRAMFTSPLRFNEVVRLVPGISHRLLMERLVELQEAGLVARCGAGRYGLTEQGLDLQPVFEAVESWNRRWLAPPDAPTT